MVLEAADPAGAVLVAPGCERLVEIVFETGRHTVIAHGTARLRLCVRQTPCRAVPTLCIPFDTVGTLRLAAAVRLDQVARGGHNSANHSGLPTTYQRTRFAQFLSLYDALETGASTRDIAFSLVFPNHRPLIGAVWKGSGERRHVLRLIAEARRMVGGGYQKLLHHG